MMKVDAIEIDLQNNVLKIDGKPVENVPVIVTLPGKEEKFPYRKLFNKHLATGNKEECDRITICYEKRKLKRVTKLKFIFKIYLSELDSVLDKVDALLKSTSMQKLSSKYLKIETIVKSA